MTAEKIVDCQPSYPKAVRDITRLDLYINNVLIDTNEKKINTEGLFSIYENAIPNPNLALFFALNNHQDSLYQYLIEIPCKIQESIINNKVLSDEEKQKHLLALSQTAENNLMVKINKVNEANYQYSITMKHPKTRKDFYSYTINIEQKEQSIIYSNLDIKLSEEAKTLLGEEGIKFFKERLGKFLSVSFGLVSATQIDVKSSELVSADNKYLTEKKYLYTGELQDNNSKENKIGESNKMVSAVPVPPENNSIIKSKTPSSDEKTNPIVVKTPEISTKNYLPIMFLRTLIDTVASGLTELLKSTKSFSGMLGRAAVSFFKPVNIYNRSNASGSTQKINETYYAYKCMI
jgi:hypothetical protein